VQGEKRQRAGDPVSHAQDRHAMRQRLISAENGHEDRETCPAVFEALVRLPSHQVRSAHVLGDGWGLLSAVATAFRVSATKPPILKVTKHLSRCG
jgi:hypothetical protein